MSTLAIKAEHLGKRYRIGAPAEPYGNLRESMMRGLAAPWRRLRRHPGAGSTGGKVWALKDVSFDVNHGEVLGIIGPNGAGKSTLLKILSRITEPTEGRAAVWGRVGSLLEVGTGFHPELTGRENIFLSGAVLGMRRPDIKRRFDEIVDFAGVEGFLDTPVKRYSSGMHVRLAFAVAAHLEPEVLVIDEVLAVGDAEFQKKCLGKMSRVAGQGRTVLFVSHNLRAVTELCSRAIVLDRGKIVHSGAPQDAVLSYLAARQVERPDGIITQAMHVHEPEEVRFLEAKLVREDGQTVSSVFADDPLHFQLRFEVRREVADVRLIVVIESIDGTQVAVLHSTDRDGPPFSGPPGTYSADVNVTCPLTPGSYFVHLEAKLKPGYWGSGRGMDWVRDALRFDVEECTAAGLGVLPSGSSVWPNARWLVSTG
jgi:lipopolysaccharide transport system ATP-binding protein